MLLLPLLPESVFSVPSHTDGRGSRSTIPESVAKRNKHIIIISAWKYQDRRWKMKWNLMDLETLLILLRPWGFLPLWVFCSQRSGVLPFGAYLCQQTHGLPAVPVANGSHVHSIGHSHISCLSRCHLRRLARGASDTDSRAMQKPISEECPFFTSRLQPIKLYYWNADTKEGKMMFFSFFSDFV